MYVLKDVGGNTVATSPTPIVVANDDTFRSASKIWLDPRPSSGAFITVTPDPLPAPPELTVTLQQFRDALVDAGQLDNLEAAIAALPQTNVKRKLINAWQYGGTISRGSNLTTRIQTALSLTDVQMDLLFLNAMRS